ncbi:MAG: hypothetical protein MMC23_002772 [Stictis urceolatum]|nr:hypothetical protein [Stictis urceolata]
MVGVVVGVVVVVDEDVLAELVMTMELVRTVLVAMLVAAADDEEGLGVMVDATITKVERLVGIELVVIGVVVGAVYPEGTPADVTQAGIPVELGLRISELEVGLGVIAGDEDTKVDDMTGGVYPE